MADILKIDGVFGGYGAADILNGVDLRLADDEIAVIIGPNGAGKSTLMKAIFGLVKVRRGQISFAGEDITGRRADQIARCGISYVPQERNVFASLTVEENLEMGAFLRQGDIPSRIAQIYDLFPVLRDRRRQLAGTMSGGERQMLAMGRALMLETRYLLLDEPTAALAPRFVHDTFQRIEEIKKLGIGILMVEQNAKQALSIADRGIVMVMGEVRHEAPGAALLDDPEVAEMYLGG